MEKMKLLLGGSPCTHWSIAQTKGRETEPSGIGWELFLNYRIARDKYPPDYFLYENNKSMSPAIRAQITRELGVEPVLINSALVSAQSRQRLYWAGRRNPDGTYSQVPVEQPEDRGILLRDVLESGFCWREKGYALLQEVAATPEDMIARRQRNGVAEPVNITDDGKAYALKANYFKSSNANFLNGGGHYPQSGAAEPVFVGEIPGHNGQYRNGRQASQQYRLYSVDGKSVCCDSDSRKYVAVPAGMAWRGRGDSSVFEMRGDQKANAVIVGHQSRLVIEAADGRTYPIHEVRDGLITIKGQSYPIKLADGFYIIRKMTVLECMRLQTVPEDYVFPVSDTQAYKMLGNGWTVDVIAYILSHFDGITTEPVEVLSMYDGMSCGHIALDKLGARVARYHATEIDKYAIQTTQTNYPETVQLGDAFQVREDGWRPQQ